MHNDESLLNKLRTSSVISLRMLVFVQRHKLDASFEIWIKLLEADLSMSH